MAKFAHPEIDEAAATAHERLSVAMCHKVLEPHLEAQDVVMALARGNVDGGLGLAALTQRSVVVASDPRVGPLGQAAAHIVALGDLTAVEWVRHGNTGTVTLRSGARCLQLKRARLRDGSDFVASVRAQMAGQTPA